MDEINLYEYWDIIRRRSRLILLCIAIAVVIAGLALLIIPRTYRGVSTLIFPAQKSGISALAAQLGAAGILQTEKLGEGNLAGTYAQIAQSRRISEAVCKELNLESVGAEPEKLQKRIEVILPKTGGLSVCCYVPASWAQSDHLPWLEEKAGRETTRDPAAVLAAEITNTLIAALQRFQQDHALTAGRRNRQFVEGELRKTQLALTDAEEDLSIFREANPTVVLQDLSGQLYEQLVNLRTEQMKSETSLKETSSQLRSAEDRAEEESETLIASEVLSSNPVVMDLKKQLAGMEIERAWLLQDRTEQHPDVIDVQERIAATTERMTSEIEEITSSRTKQLNPIKQKLVENAIALEVQETGLTARVEALEQVLTEAENEIAGMTKPQLELVRLVREAKALETIDTLLRAELAKAQIEEAKEPQDFIVLDSAKPEKNHFRPRTKLTIFAALMLGLMAGTMLTFLAEGAARARKSQRVARDHAAH